MKPLNSNVGLSIFLSISCNLALMACTEVQPNSSTAADSQTILVPGDTLGNATLQADSLPAVYQEAAIKLPDSDCAATDFSVVDTKVRTLPEDPSAETVLWSEIWTVEACGDTIDVDLQYLKDSRGVSFSAK